MSKIGAKTRENLLPLKGFWCIMLSFLHFSANFLGCQFGQMGQLNAIKTCLQQFKKHSHDVNITLFPQLLKCDSIEKDELTNIPMSHQKHT